MSLKRSLALILAAVMIALSLPLAAIAEDLSSDILRIDFEKLEIVERSNGYWAENEKEEKFFYYYFDPEYTVYFKDGSSVESNYGCIYYNGEYCYLDYSYDQYENPWYLGNTYTIPVSLRGYSASFEVSIVETPIERVEFYPYEIMENSEGYMELNSQEAFFRYNLSPRFDVYFKDGSVFEDCYGIEYNNRYYSLECEDVQAKNHFTAGNTYHVSAFILGYDTSFDVSITENPVDRIEVEPMELFENDEGYWCYNEEEPYFNYSLRNPDFTVYFKDGSAIPSDHGSIEYNGETYWISCSSEQYDNHWYVGNTYTATARIMGKETTFNVSIVETPIDKIEFEKLELTENVDGYLSEYLGEEYFHYRISQPAYTVYYKDGSSASSDENGYIEYKGNSYQLKVEDNQHLGHFYAGKTYSVSASILGYKDSFDVSIIETEVARIEFEKVEVIENTDGYMTQYNGEEFYYYHFPIPAFTVYFKDGSSVYSDNGLVEHNGKNYYLSRYYDQDKNHWYPGNTYQIPVSILGYNGYLEVSIIESPVERIEFAKMKIPEGLSGHKEIDDFGQEYFCYSIPMPEFTVYFKDGSSRHINGSGLEYNGNWYPLNYSDDQYANHWYPGNTYSVSASILGYNTTIEISIVSSPVSRVEITDIEMFEKSDGYITNDGESDYFRYRYYPDIKAYFNDGSVLEGNGGITYNGNWYPLNYSDDQYVNHWYPGNSYTVSASLLGCEASFNVSIVASPVASIEAKPLQLVENGNGYMRTYNDGTFFYYEATPNFTVHFKDGTTFSGEGGFTYNGKWVSAIWSDDQYNEHWTLGNTYTVQANFMGFDFSYEVSIIKTPIEKIEFGIVSLMEESSGYFDSGLGQYIYSYLPDFKVYFKDGTISASDMDGRVIYNKRYYRLSIFDDQNQNPWGVGIHKANASLLGFETSFDVEIREFEFVKLEILSVGKLYENRDCYLDYDGSMIYNMPAVVYKITDKTGRSYINSTMNSYEVTISHNQNENPWVVGGENKFTAHFGKLSAEGTVVIEPSSDFEYFEQDGGIYIIDFYPVGAEEIIIPAEIEGKPVIGVFGLGYYYNMKYCKSIKLPDSVKIIGQDAFMGARNLETLYIGSGVENLDAHLFSECYMLESIEVSEDNPNYKSVDGVVYDKALTTLIVYPFGRTAEYSIPETVTNIDILFDKTIYDFTSIKFAEGSAAFVTDSGITYNADKTIVISCDPEKEGAYIMPQSVEKIEPYAFSRCDKLTKVEISENVTDIMYGSFQGCESLAEIKLPANLQSIDSFAFCGCTALEGIDLPEGIKSLGMEAFSCSGLKSISMPDSIISMDMRVFCECENLEEAKLSKGIDEIPYGTFYYCTKLYKAEIPENIIAIGGSAFYHTAISSIDIPKSVQLLGSYCFAGTKISEIVIPDTVIELEEGVFLGCAALTCADIGTAREVIPSAFFSGTGFSTYTIPKSVKYIGASAFSNCKHLREVIFTSSDIEIGDGAFSGSALKNLNLPEGIKNTGERYAFEYTDITALRLPDSVTEITYGSFLGCAELYDIEIPESVISIGGYSFDETGWDNAQPNGEEYLENVFYKYKGVYDGSGKIDIKDGTTIIADFALEDKIGINEINLPDGIITIGAWSFFNTSIEEINIPASVRYIDASAFSRCEKLSAINVDKDNRYFKSIDGVLFTKDGSELIWCPKRASAVYEVPAGVKLIRMGAFSESGIETIKIMDPETELETFSVGFKSAGYMDDYMWDRRTMAFGKIESGFIITFCEIVCPENSKAAEYAADNDIFVTYPKEISIVSEEAGISIDTTDDQLPENTVMKVETKEKGNIVIIETETDTYDYSKCAVFDISLSSNGEKVQPRGEITVSIEIPENLDAKRCRILYVDESGNITDMKARVINNKMEFETDHFSQYMIIEAFFAYGDAKEDDEIDMKDIVLIREFLSEFNYETGTSTVPVALGADANGDGLVDMKDIVLLRNYLAEYNYSTGTSPVALGPQK